MQSVFHSGSSTFPSQICPHFSVSCLFVFSYFWLGNLNYLYWENFTSCGKFHPLLHELFHLDSNYTLIIRVFDTGFSNRCLLESRATKRREDHEDVSIASRTAEGTNS